MKMLKCILVFAMLFAVLAGCSKKPQSATPTETATQATLALTETTDAPTRETTEPTNATEETAAPTDNTEPATQITAVPTESIAASTQATAVATRPTAKPTQATTVATKSATIATQTTAAATKPATAATKPVAATTQATTAATKPATAATTQATTAATKPVPTATQGTKPAATAHNYTVTSDTATCTAAGKKTETCTLCGDQKVTDSRAKGHGTTRTETQEATTVAAGYTRVVCTVCNVVISENPIPKLEDTHNCADHMQRINCKNLQDGAVGIHTDKFRQYTSVTILACSKCGYADTSSMQFAYTSAEATAIIVEMINQLRYEVYGTHAYDVAVASHHSASEWAAKHLTTDFFACTPFVENIAHINLNGNLVKRLFEAWKNSPGHYAWLIDKDMRYFSLGVYISEEYGTHSSLVMWNKDELYLDNPNYTWVYR